MYNTKFTTVQDYVSSAISMTQEDQTFAAKSHQKEALGQLNSGYQMLRENNFQFSIDSLSREDYYAIPFDLHQIREKHFRLFDKAHHAELTDLMTFRVLLKELEVVKPAPKTDRITAKQAEVTETVVDLIERRMAQYHEAVELGRLFGGLPVSVTPHQVTNGHNTTFTRCFYYLAGKFTPLQVILGAMDTLAQEKESA
jgi:hypothetical protein